MTFPKNPHPDRHRLLGQPPSAETLRFLGISEEEWRFVQGRYEIARKELRNLRTGVKRVAEATKDREVTDRIPHGTENDYDERGWNYLCGYLCGYIERLKRDNECLRAFAVDNEEKKNADV